MELPFFTTTAATCSATTRAEALRWLAIAEKLLAGRDLVGSKSFAARARESDPTLLYADQIIAVADTLLSGDKRINNLHDWYSVLQLTPQQSRDAELIAGQYRKLALLLNPQKNKLPFADQAFTLVVNAWQVLSNPSRKNLYDSELMAHLRVNPVSPVPPGFNPASPREQVNYHPFEINFQVMPQHTMSNREQVMQPTQPQHGTVREPTRSQILPEPTRSQILPQQNLTRQPMSQNLPQQNLSREQEREPQPPPLPQAQLPPQPRPQAQPQPQPQQQQRKDNLMGNNATHNFSTSIGNASNANDNNNVHDDDVDVGNNSDVNRREKEGRKDGSSDDGALSFWTACPYCYYMYEYPSVYADCTLKCQNCRKAFQGVELPSPPPIVDGQDAYFCCWGLMPLGVSMEILERNRGKGGKWTPFSPMFTCPKGMGSYGNAGNWNVNNGKNNAAGPRSGNVGSKKKSSGPRVYVDDEDVFLEYSDPSEESDDDWRTEMRKKKAKGEKKMKVVKNKGTGTPGRRGRPPKVDKGKNPKGESENVQEGLVVQVGVEVPNASSAESSKKAAATSARRHSARVAKDFGKLDLNVEFNNEVEEPAPRVVQGNGTGRGEEDIIEGSGFFEGLDEFLSTLPILNVVGDDKVKAA